MNTRKLAVLFCFGSTLVWLLGIVGFGTSTTRMLIRWLGVEPVFFVVGWAACYMGLGLVAVLLIAVSPPFYERWADLLADFGLERKK